MASRSRPRSESRRNTPLSPPKALPPAIAPDASNQNKRKTRSSSREIATAQQQPLPIIEQTLSTVHEQEDDVGPVQNGEVDDDFSDLRPSSTGSSLQESLDALNRDAILDNLGAMYRDSGELINLFKNVSDQSLREFVNSPEQANPRFIKNLITRTKRLLEDRENYGQTDKEGSDDFIENLITKTKRLIEDRENDGETDKEGSIDFIDLQLILRKIFRLQPADDIPNVLYRPDAVIHLANLALQVIQVSSPDKRVRVSYTRVMFNEFPQLFNYFSHFQPGLEVWEGMCDVWADVLTQFYLGKVEMQQNQVSFDPDATLAEVFLDENDSVPGQEDPYRLERCLERMDMIRAYFDSNSSSFIDFEGLKEKYPWSDYAVRTVKWALGMKTELEKSVESKRGITWLVDKLAEDFDDDAAQTTRRKSNPDGEEDLSEGQHERDDLIPPRATKADVIPTPTHVTDKRHGVLPAHNNARGSGSAHESLTRSSERSISGPAAGGSAAQRNKDLLEEAKARFAAVKSGSSWNMTPHDDSQSEVESQPNREVAQSPSASYHDEGPGMGMEDEQDADEDESVIQRGDHAADDSDDEDVIATQQAALLLDKVRQQQEETRKESARATAKKPSFLDPQPGAQTVEWDNDYPNDEDILSRSRRSPKRARNQVHDDSDEDDAEFETDTRAAKRSRIDVERIRKPASARARLNGAGANLEGTDDLDDGQRIQPHALTSRPRVDPPGAAMRKSTISQERRRPTAPSLSPPPQRSASQRSPTSRAPIQPISSGSRAVPSSSAPARSDPTAPSSSLPSSRRLPPSHQDPPLGASRLPSASQEPPSTQARRVNQEAKERMRMARDLKQARRPVQIRIPYSAEEVDRLTEMIALYGTQWARMLNEDKSHPDGAALQGRTQVQLKDKARNLKLDALKAGQPLAPGFEFVSVGNKELEKLRQLGIDYFEGDGAARYTGRGGRYVDDELED
ncbi:hypothetical protein H2200_008434 [Cladophialophora chaetospira]|uniref:Myb-like domain-containing protein n=1 Tax=Cladophialophora chaetospira TaxID=386627 RepID=A0AA39CGL1_9EURO|nr:hypothetical protein H2200_008434 [Cladophialophora chaetospira]